MEEAAAVAESWYQLPAEEDASVFIPTLTETGVLLEHTDFPSMEEGTLSSQLVSSKGFLAGQKHSLHLETQDSRLSPHLPLLTSDSSPAHKYFDDTMFQQTDTEFAPLRGSLDMSEFPGPSSKSLQMSDAVVLASKEVLPDQVDKNFSLSQRYLGMSHDDDTSSIQNLSEHSLSISHRNQDDNVDSTEHGSGVRKPGASEDLLWPSVEDLTSQDGAFLSSSVPAPVLLKLLEKEVGLSGSSETSTRCSSQTISINDLENLDVLQQGSEAEEDNTSISQPVGTWTIPEQIPLHEESFRDSSQIRFFNDYETEKEDADGPSQLNHSGITVRRPSQPGLHKQLCSEIQQGCQEKELSKSSQSSGSTQNAPVQPNESRTESQTGVQDTSTGTEATTEPAQTSSDTVVALPPKDEMSSSSRGSIERGHPANNMSDAGTTPIDEMSFIGRLAHPISQSTPGMFSVNRKPLSGRIQQIKAKLTGSDMSLNEEPSDLASGHKVSPAKVQQSAQSSQGYLESSDSQTSLSPQRQRIQSLPSLNYIEKVGAWNTNQSFDSLVLRGLTGVSPKKLAFNAVADSLNRIFSKQTSNTEPKRGPAVFVKGTSSMTNLNAGGRESSSLSHLNRSQSYNSVITASDANTIEKRTEDAVQPATEEGDEVAKARRSRERVSQLSRDVHDREVTEDIRASDLGQTDLALGESHLEHQKSKDRSTAEPEKTPSTLTHNKNFVKMDCFSDVSLDHEFSGSSHSTDRMKEVLLDSGPAITDHQIALEEGSGTVWACSNKTPELNIEERIPVYLRNLGIDQSPTAILTPFAPKGPIREPEFSPTELRTIKGSTATPNRSMRLSEGGSQSAANISQSSLYSSTSTTSVSIPMGSEAGPGSPSPTEMSSHLSPTSTAQDEPTTWDQGGFSLPENDGEPAKRSLVTQPTNDLNSTRDEPPVLQYEDKVGIESTQVKQLIGQFESSTSHVTDVPTSFGNLGQGASLPSLGTDSVNDSFVGSRTLKEIRKLLSEVDDGGLGGPRPGLELNSPLTDPYRTSAGNLGDSMTSDALKSRSISPLDLQLQGASWDTSFNSSVTSENLLNKDPSRKADLQWEESSIVPSQIKDDSYWEDVSDTKHPLREPYNLHRHHGRAEPDGSSEAASKRLPSSVQCGGYSAGTQRTGHLLSGAVGSLKQTLAATRTGYIRGKEAESDESSGDSLATRVTTLLQSGAWDVQSGAEDERRPRGTMKLKLAAQPVSPDTELDDEDRRRIEEIKRELLAGARIAGLEKNRYDAGVDARHFGQTRDRVRFQRTPSPFFNQSHGTSSHDSLGSSATELAPNTYAIGSTVPDTSNTVRSINEPLTVPFSDQPPVVPGYHQPEPLSELHNLEQLGRTVLGLESRTMPPISSSDDAANPVGSITFSSRKRSSPTSPEAAVPEQLSAGTCQDFFVESTVDAFSKDNPLHATSDIIPSVSLQPDVSEVTGTMDRDYSKVRELHTPAEDIYDLDIERSGDPLINESSTAVRPEQNIISRGAEESRSYMQKTSLAYSNTTTHSSLPELRSHPTTVSSPTKKALSCIHVTISPKEDLKVLDMASIVLTPGSAHEVPHGVRTDLEKFKSIDLSRNKEILTNHNLSSHRDKPYSDCVTSSLSEDGRRKTYTSTEDKENIPDRPPQVESRRSPLSDATTQITTESPQKTTFSAEIFIDRSVKDRTPSSSSVKVNRAPEPQPLSRSPLSGLSRATDQPLLLPYRPPGSPELFYVPYMAAGSRVSSPSTIESSHTGSNDAVSPKFPAEVLGSASEKISDKLIPRHKEGIYSKDGSPQMAWGAAQRLPPAGEGYRDEWKRSASSHHKVMPQPDPQTKMEKELGDSCEATLGSLQPNQEPGERSGGLRGQPRSSLRDNEFFPLQPEVDYTQEESCVDLQLSHKMVEESSELPQAKKTDHTTTRQPVDNQPYPPAGSKLNVSDKPSRKEEAIDVNTRVSKPESKLSQSLDDLWARFTEGKKSRLSDSSNTLEVSLVERLDRLARLLQNPAPFSMLSSDNGKNGVRVSEDKGKSERRREIKKAEREKWYRKKVAMDSLLVEVEAPDDSASRLARSETFGIGSLGSDLSSGKSAVTESTTTTTGTSSRTDSEGTVRTGMSGSISTIDTVRLINAFGRERVRPSSKLTRLYNTIDLQKKHTEKTSTKPSRGNRNKGADSITSSSSSWEPSPALVHKRVNKVHHKGIQAGDLEIVMSATRKHTRDVGTTFPSPRGEPHHLSVNPDSDHTLRGPKDRQVIPPGLTWFVAVDLKSDSRKENKPEVVRGRGSAWYEPVTHTRPWREPLREKVLQEQTIRRVERLISEAQSLDKADGALVRVTLQESLKTFRPDFIFRSGERVKRLQLLAKERKLQSVFQGERDELFNMAQRRGIQRYPKPYEDKSSFQKSRTVPRREMVQRSKRIYEQLPEIRKRKEEEKRRSEYETNRLKAQLFRKKVTNQILGRKTPWS